MFKHRWLLGFPHAFQLVILWCISQLVGHAGNMPTNNQPSKKKRQRRSSNETMPKRGPIIIDVPFVRKIEVDFKVDFQLYTMKYHFIF